MGDPIPTVDYVDDEIKTWGIVFDKIQPLVQKYACKEYLEIIPELHKECG